MYYLPLTKINFMKYILPVLTLFIFSCKQKSNKTTDVKLASVLDNYAAAYYKLKPLDATKNGIMTYNDQLAINISPDHVQKMLALNKSYLDTLATIDTTKLTYSEQLSVDILRFKLEMENEAYTMAMASIVRSTSLYSASRRISPHWVQARVSFPLKQKQTIGILSVA